MTLTIIAKSQECFKKLKNHFEGESAFMPFDSHEEGRYFEFSVDSQEDADSLELEIEKELNKVQFDAWYHYELV